MYMNGRHVMLWTQAMPCAPQGDLETALLMYTAYTGHQGYFQMKISAVYTIQKHLPCRMQDTILQGLLPSKLLNIQECIAIVSNTSEEFDTGNVVANNVKL